MSLAAGSEVRYLRAGDQIIDASLFYYDLTLEGSGNKSINSALTVREEFKLLGTARFSNYNRNVNCGSDLINNSTATHIFGGGTYTFTGTTIGGGSSTVIDSATVNFEGSSITLGDGSYGNGNITLKNVSFSNSSSDLTFGANGYSGTVTVDGLLSMTGTNATLTVAGGSFITNNVAVSGSNSTVAFLSGSVMHQITGYLNCGNNLSVQTPVSVGGNVDVSGNLVVNSEFDVTGTTVVGGNLSVTGSNTPAVNNFGGMVTINGASAHITGGKSAFAGGFTHNTISSGSTCVISTDYSDGSGTIATTINAENVSISAGPTFNRLVLSNPLGTAYGYSNLTVNHSVSLAKDLDMTGYTMTFPQTAPLTALSGAGEIIGTVRRTLQAPGTYTFNGAYTTLMVPTLLTAQDYQFKLGLFAPDQQAVLRCYDIQRVGSDLTPAAWQYTLGLQYRDSELNGNNENLLLMAYGELDIAGEDDFEKLSSSTVNTSSNILSYVFDGTLTFNHRYIFGDLNAPLPVELVAFSAYRKDATVDLRWETATELNNYGFEIERASWKDGPYTMIGFVEGQGTKHSPSQYAFNDAAATKPTAFYRLKQIDRDGSITYSDAIEVASEDTRIEVANYPNPFNPATTITFTSPADGHARMMVFNVLGECVAQPYDADVRENETVSVFFDATALPGGTYFYTVQVGDVTQTGKMLLTK
ncbi:MAG: T9SS type A sorting domain-containing protein [Bacteroidetes bacterium]|nr:T9SS type A sorting domain-containing protein [Bacteroidota bacterium]